MRLYLILPLMALIVEASAAKPHRQLNGWFPCSTATFSDTGSLGQVKAECATFTAPLCYPGICKVPETVDDTVDIFVKRLPATSGDEDAANNVWLLQGGPGFSSTGMETDMATLHTQLNGTVNVYTMDHRGTGRSTRLDCVASQSTTTGSSSATGLDIKEVPACAKSLQNKYGDLASFSTTSAATDIVTFLSDYSNGANTIVYGVSYGTMLVERLMHLKPPKVVGYVLDSITTTSGAPPSKFLYGSTYDVAFGEVAEAFMALCDEDKECNDRFGPSGLQDAVQDLIELFDKDPNSTCATATVDGVPPSYTLRRTLGTLLLDSTTRTLIPPVVYRLQRCSSEDEAVLTFFLRVLANPAATTQEDAFASNLLLTLINYSEMWENPPPSMEAMTKRFTDASMSDTGAQDLVEYYCAYSKDDSPVCKKLGVGDYEADGIIYERDEYWNKAATIPKGVSVLLLQGKLDARTPPKYAEYLLDALIGKRKELITFDYAAHGTVATTQLTEGDYESPTCGMILLASYVINGGDLKSLDRSCVDKMPAFNLTSSYDIRKQYLSTDDAYDGEYVGEKVASSTSK